MRGGDLWRHKLQARKDRITKGEATVKDFIALHGGEKLWDTGKPLKK